MRSLSIQVQPNRSHGMDMDYVSAVFEDIAALPGLSEKFAAASGDDQEPYFNYTFDTKRFPELWREIRLRTYSSGELGLHMRRASLAVCSGEWGWDDYLLLFHFDPTLKIDPAPES